MSRKVVTLWMEAGCDPLCYYKPAPPGALSVGVYMLELDDKLHDDEELWSVLTPLQEEFDKTCFVDGTLEIVGFASDEVMEAFNDQLEAAYAFLRVHLEEKYPGEYEVVEHPRAYFYDRMAVY